MNSPVKPLNQSITLLWQGLSSLVFGLGLPLWAMSAEQTSLEDTLLLTTRDLIGTRAPEFRLETVDGETLELADSLGNKAVYLKFWATWCVPCRQQMPHFEAVYQAAGEDLEVIAVNTGFNDSLQDIRDYREELGIHMPVVVDDGTLAGAFNLRITPQHVVIGKDGLIKYIGTFADAELDAVLERERKAPALPASTGAPGLAVRPPLGIGDPLPASLPGIDGDSAGPATGTVLVFMIPWCEAYLATTRPEQSQDCRAVREQVETLRQQHPGVRWQGVSSGIWTVAADLATYTRENAVTLPLTLDNDGQLFRTFGVMTVPTVIVADAAGNIVARVEGYDPALETMIPAP